MEGWTFVLTYGYSLELYARGDERKIIDRNTCRVVVEYLFKK